MRQLPILHIAGDDWFVDERLCELRRVDNPHERLSMDEAKVLIALEQRLERIKNGGELEK